MKAIVDDKLKDIYEEAIQILREHQKYLLKYNNENALSKAMYPIKEVVINKRMNVSRRGCCKYKYYNGTKYCVIEISEYMLAVDRKETLTTMVHELLHTFKDSRGHTGNWLWRANYLKDRTGLNIQRTRSIEGANEAMYELRKEKQQKRSNKIINRIHSSIEYTCKCKKCGATITHHKKSKFIQHPERYTHRGCGGHFENINTRVLLDK